MKYQLLSPSEVKDEVDGEHYPDPLSLSYTNLPMEANPFPLEAPLEAFLRPDIFLCSKYSLSEDIVSALVLDYNGVPHRDIYRQLVENGVSVTLYLPTGKTWQALREEKVGDRLAFLFNPI